MGKLEVDDLHSINHFSHEHPLELIDSQGQGQTKALTTCSACKGNIFGSVYACISCNFYLHKTCSTLPRTLSHQVDQQHSLVLLASPAYPEGAFRCNACGSSGTGFSYHCPDCQLDLHTVCAFMPLSIKHVDHDHALALCFEAPYGKNAFRCDICKGHGSNHWLYRCGLCEFDAHMKCAKANKKTTSSTTSQALLVKSRSVPTATTSVTQRLVQQPPSAPPQILQQNVATPYIQTYNSFPGSRVYDRSTPHQYQFAPNLVSPQYVHQAPRQESLMSNLAGHAVEGLMGGIAQELAQIVLQ